MTNLSMTQSQPSLKLPGEANPDFSRVVSEYLSHFEYFLVVRDPAIKQSLYQWCVDYMGEQYKDWFIHEGGRYDKWWVVNIRNPKHGTMFALRWTEIVLERVDRRVGNA